MSTAALAADDAGEARRRALVAEVAAAERQRLRYRHLLPLAVALGTMTLCGLGLGGARWSLPARLLGVREARLTAVVPLLALVYVLAACLAAYAWARFDLRRAAGRLPLVLVGGAVGIGVLLGALWLHSGAAGSYAAGLPDDVADAELKSLVEGETPEEPATAPAGRRSTRGGPALATLLLDAGEAAAVLGGPVGPGVVPAPRLQRGVSFCLYRTRDRTATLGVTARGLPGPGALRRLFRRGEPLAGLGERAVAVRGAVWVVSGEWLLSVSVRRRDGAPVDRERQVEAARRAVERLSRPREPTVPTGD